MKRLSFPGRVEVIPVRRRQQFLQFIKFPWKIYRDYPLWVPPLIREEKERLNPRKNPFFNHARMQLFLARKGNNLVGRIAAIIDEEFVRFRGEKKGFFGFYESSEDEEVARGLLTEAEKWLRARGMEGMLGPMNPSTNDQCAFLIEGFDLPPMFMMSYNPPYYPDLMESCGLIKAKDLYAYYCPVRKDFSLRMQPIAERAKKRGMRVRPVRMGSFARELEVFKEVYNSAWRENWGFVPLSDKEIDYLAQKFKPLIVPELFVFAEIEGQTIGVLLALPDYNYPLKKMNGRTGPLQLLKFLWYRRRIRQTRLIVMGLSETYRHRGLQPLIYLKVMEAAARFNYVGGELSWILEDNVLSQKLAGEMGARLYKKYRIYQKNF